MAETLEMAIGNPLYHWSHLELQRYFGYEGVLNGDTAEEVWNLCNEKLKGMSAEADSDSMWRCWPPRTTPSTISTGISRSPRMRVFRSKCFRVASGQGGCHREGGFRGLYGKAGRRCRNEDYIHGGCEGSPEEAHGVL